MRILNSEAGMKEEKSGSVVGEEGEYGDDMELLERSFTCCKPFQMLFFRTVVQQLMRCQLTQHVMQSDYDS